MSNNPLRDLIFGPDRAALASASTPRRSFADVVLPPSTRRALDNALVQIQKHDLIFGEWGLGERHESGLGLAFNFAGPPGTGKTICAEAIAHALGKRLLVVRYNELESQWAGATAKNVAAVFASAQEENAVLFFDEADAIAGRRFTSMDQGYQREANAVVNVLLRELEEFPGVVIFATNLAANFDPAFERRIRTHILFEQPGPEEREKIWKVQIHARKTPLAADVDFAALAQRYPLTGGDIKNAVLKAAQMAIAEPGPDAEKRIAQRHFEGAVDDVLASRRVMDQSLFGESALAGMAGLAGSGGMDDEVSALSTRLVEVEDTVTPLSETLRRMEKAQARSREDAERLREDVQRIAETAARAGAQAAERQARTALVVSVAAAVGSALALLAALL
ncbi:MAG TPA: ATP-binding protein [Longimicrobium sp.]|jgi:SpoVK/Ycf46/Vps4 family AAA+-type ATPase|uniref:ATP-binding protein n=1 Tax=Longimicrobium sp. TaxID=2029185 RepID=UPI002ED8A8E4